MTVREAHGFFGAVPAWRASCRRCSTSAWATCSWASRRPRSRAARRSGSSFRSSCPSATPGARSTSWTSRPPACTSTTSSCCSTCCTGCAMRATPWWSSSTTSTSSRPPTGSSTSARGRRRRRAHRRRGHAGSGRRLRREPHRAPSREGPRPHPPAGRLTGTNDRTILRAVLPPTKGEQYPRGDPRRGAFARRLGAWRDSRSVPSRRPPACRSRACSRISARARTCSSRYSSTAARQFVRAWC
jgi:hypothetical protein